MRRPWRPWSLALLASVILAGMAGHSLLASPLSEPGPLQAAPVAGPDLPGSVPMLPDQTLSASRLAARLRGSGDLAQVVCAPTDEPMSREGEVVAPILLYHFIGRPSMEVDGKSQSRYNVTIRDFETQLALLHHLGYQTVTVDEVARALRGEIELPGRVIALTFDDGWAEHYAVVFPLLRLYDMRATFFVPSAYAVGGRLVTWEQLGEMSAAGMEIGAHTRKHVNLLEVSSETAWQEIVTSRLTLQAQMGITVTTMAYPYGMVNSGTVELVRRAGYSAATALGPLVKHTVGRIYALPRIEVRGNAPLADFIALLPWRGDGAGLCRSLLEQTPHRVSIQ